MHRSSRDVTSPARRRSWQLFVPLALVGATLVLAINDAGATTSTVRVRVAPATVQAGKSVVVDATVRPTKATCRLTLASPGGSTRALASKRARGAHVSWTWRVPTSAMPGRWAANVACIAAGGARAWFRVAAPPPPPPPVIPARLVVEKSGFGVEAFDSSTFVGYGAVIRNVSPDEDAGDVTLLVNIIGTSGQVLESESDFYEVIPADTEYYAGGLAYIDQGYAPVARIEVSVSFSERHIKSVTLPPASSVRVQADSFGTAEVAGEVQNPSTTKALSGLASITAVAFDSAGNVIGGGWDSPPADVPPGARTGFAVPIVGRFPSEVASAQVSVEPHYR